MSKPCPPTTVPVDQDIAIIGSGFAGLGMAIRLAGAGVRSFTVFEQASSVGGTWRDNTYPSGPTRGSATAPWCSSSSRR